MEKLEKIYEGKAKQVFTTKDPDLVVQHFKDDATAFDGTKKDVIDDKGRLNNQISSIIFTMLADRGIKTHFREKLNERDMLVVKLDIIPLEVVVRNVAAGSISKRLGLPEGEPLPFPVLEFYLKDDALHDPLINYDHIKVVTNVTDGDVKVIETKAKEINAVLRPWFEERGLTLVDFKLEFGKTARGEILLGDEISPDTCRLWDKETHEKLDKDRFRRDMGKVKESYEEILRRISKN